jgi:hypothetical protein
MYEERLYRNRYTSANLKFFNVCIYETDLSIGACSDLSAVAEKEAAKLRGEIEAYIKAAPLFLTSLEPIEVNINAPEIIRRMAAAAKLAGVGPMAAVAGAISELTGYGLLKYSDEVIVENGGDIFMSTKTTRKIGIYAGNSPLSDKLALEIDPSGSPLGICTSSGTVGHSLSFGKADAAVIISKDTFLADAAATALGNRVKTADDIENALQFAASVEGVTGAVVIIGDKLGAWGDVKLTRL